mmetsp:Transcript_20336/g.30958  ORF Transcript_20336/g.30958 Transcript_20336/m.30958 type:complete len:417 (-) Transcript_20336:86-1336(-)
MNEDYMYSFDGYSLKYVTCQPIQRFSQGAAQNGEFSALVTDDIVLLRLCPYRQCTQTAKYGCKSGYGEYAINLSDYLSAMMRYEADKRKNLCNFCAACSRRYRRLDQADAVDDGWADDDDDFYKYIEDDENVDDGGANQAAAANDDDTDDNCYEFCQDYYDTCRNGRNGNGNGNNNNQDDDNYGLDYEDYLDYMYCKEEEGDNEFYWVSPRCSTSTNAITMGIFFDPYCSLYAGSEVNVNEFTGMSFQNSIFESMYSGECIPCSKDENPPYYGSNWYMCNKVFDTSAKCNNYASDLYQGEDESLTCSFIESIRFGTYDANGQVYSGDTRDDEIQEQVTGFQVFTLTLVTMTVIGLSIYSCYLHHAITNLLLKSLSQSHLASTGIKRRRSSRIKHRGRDQDDDDWDHSLGKTKRSIT